MQVLFIISIVTGLTIIFWDSLESFVPLGVIVATIALIFFKGRRSRHTSLSKEEKGIVLNFKKGDIIWFGEGTTVNIQGLVINNPWVYLKKSNRKSSACHVIPAEMKITYSEDYEDHPDYWPSYSDLNEKQRGTFLRWLSEGKNDASIDIGYVFIYFYGLEYRVIEENKDLEAIAYEVIRLRKYYIDNKSFKNYSEGLLAYILSKLKDTPEAKKILSIIKPSLQKSSHIYQTGIDLLVNHRESLDEKELISLVPKFENTPRSSVPDKVGDYFYEYFLLIAQDIIKEALPQIKLNKENQVYFSASSFLQGTKESFEIVKVSVDKKIQRQLIKKWIQAIEDFKPYSRKLNRYASNEIFKLIPEELRKTLPHHLKDKLKEIEANLINRPVKISELAQHMGMSISNTLNPDQAQEIVNALLSEDMIIEPNLAYFKKAYKPDDFVLISKFENATMQSSDEYKLAALITDFGVDLAYCDDDYHEEEAYQIFSIISENFLKEEIDKEHLKLRVSLYYDFPPKMSGVFKELSKSLSISGLKALSDYLMSIALADGVFTDKEDKKIRSSLSKLGLEEAYIKDLYAKFGVQAQEAPVQEDNVELRPSQDAPENGSLIPPQKEEKEEIILVSPTPPSSIKIDRDKLKKIAEETKKVRAALSDIIDQQEIQDKNLIKQEEVSVKEDDENVTLDSKHESFLKILLSKESWDKKELRDIARSYKLMISDAISKINDWYEKKHGDYLIFEETQTYCVQKAIQKGKEHEIQQ